MSTDLDNLLQQYGLNNGAPKGALASSQLSALSAPAPGAESTDPAIGTGPLQQAQTGLDYAKQLAATAQHAIHSTAQAAAKMPGAVGAIGGVVAGTIPDPQQLPSVVQSLIRRHESRDNYSALNQQGSTASGAYQYTDPTWNGYGGYSRAAFAPRAVQDARAQQDGTANLAKFNGDPFKAIAAHYLPAAAANPATWTQPYRLASGKTVSPVADYVKQTVAGTPLQGQFDAYLKHYAS
jgi:phage-related tail protein